MLNKENKKIMEVFFCSRTTKVAVLLSIYINCAIRGYTDNILGFGGVGTLPQMLNRGIGSHPIAQKKGSKLAY